MLIDGGGFHRDNFDVGKMVVAPFLLDSKIRTVDYLVLSHPQADHMNGLRFIASQFGPKEFWYNGERVDTQPFKDLMRILESKEIEKCLLADLMSGREISGVKVEVLHPCSRDNAKKAVGLNNNSLVLKLSYKGQSLLFPGDLERQGEQVVVSNAGHLLKSDILLAPHHGSKTSCSEPFLQRVKPRICIVSSGSGNYSGFPHQATLERLKGIGCRIIRIDQEGAVHLHIGPNRLEARSFLNGALQTE